ncbi:MAG: TraM recognition domain-containing protein [Ferrovum myxofaciens]|uniref:type IV secretory system conjugative DNA transfer family protein n=1 Tax=Ferrovum myxofaciens TaxID=416213 RepID=UPI001AF42DD5|nr:TraM recognition domain-containing protein [Ferrovum myxofaciens]QKE37322.1 MAG: TraM recognition domain-containing protein [Ferrovum myxofaciens]QWY74968.1 MAG: TraM recognition domain-containing protein [Ferrovum myxofaciens]
MNALHSLTSDHGLKQTLFTTISHHANKTLSLTSLSLAMTGGAILASRVIDTLRHEIGGPFESKLKIRSAPTENKSGTLLGYLVDTGEPLYASFDEMVRHISIVGQSGVGKTVFGQLLMFQQMAAGGGLVFVDGKLDSETLNEIYRMAAYHGREHDVLVINPGNPEFSNTYNPIRYGDPDEVADRIVALIPSTESDAGADHYKQSAKQGCTVLIAALQKTGLSYTFIDLVILLQSPTDLMNLEEMLPVDSPERGNLAIFLDQYRVPDKTGQKTIDIKRLKETFGGIIGRLFTFGTGSFGGVMNTTSPEINLFEAIKANKIIYVMLPTMGKSQTASNLGKMFLGDARTTFSWLQALPESEKPNPPLLFFMDEVGSYATDALSRPFEQARSAHVILVPAYQTVANLEAVSPEFLQMVTGNTWIKVCFKVGTHETAEFVADNIGEEMQVQASLSIVGGSSASGNVAGVSPDLNAGTNENIGYGERAAEGYRVSPADLKALVKGEAIITIGGDRVYHVRVPLISQLKEFKADYPVAKINHFRTKFARGINLFKSAQIRLGSEAKDRAEDKQSKWGKVKHNANKPAAIQPVNSANDSQASSIPVGEGFNN